MLAKRQLGAWSPPRGPRLATGRHTRGHRLDYAARFAVEWFANQLDIHHYLGTDVRSGGEIAHVWGRDKARWLQGLVSSSRISRHRVAAVGDSHGDTEMLRAAHLRFFVGAAPSREIPALVHLPNADLRLVADRIIDAWADR